jgi:hypothetical protein
MYYVETIVGGTVTFFLVILVLLKLVKVRLGAGVVVLALGLSMVCRVASGIALPFIGAHPSEHFLDGFGARVYASGVHANALAWGDQILTDESLNSQGVRLVRLSPDRIPPFFAAAIGSSEPIEAIVYYGKESRQAASVRVQADEGVHWGIWISKETQMNLDLSDPKPRWIAERFHVFISYDK